MDKIEKIKYLIIGNSAGGIGAVEAIREADKTGTITVVSDEPFPVYSRPLISDFLAGKRTIDQLNYRAIDFYEQNDIKTIFGNRVTELNLDDNIVLLESGQKLAWDKLLLATGGTPIVPPMEGREAGGVFTFTTLADAIAIDDYIRQKPDANAVVIGGGLIGVSVTESLLKRRVKVTIIEMKERILNVILDNKTSYMEHKAVKDCGADIITGHTVSKINSNTHGEVYGVTLDNGDVISCGMVIIAIGVRPRLELVNNTDIKVNRGIAVDKHMQTSVPGIYACGDVAEAFDFIYGENRLTPVWPNAYLGGRTAGLNMAGKATDYPGGTNINSMKYFGIYIVSAGTISAPDKSYQELIAEHNDVYKKLILKDGLVTGMIFSGEVDRAGIIYNLMKDRVNVESFKQSLISDDMGLLSLPETVWRNRLATVPPVNGVDCAVS